MRFLIDEALSPKVAELLLEAGYDTVHVGDYELHGATDVQVLKRAADEDRILVSADTDFGTLLALREQVKPSFVLLRSGPKRPEDQAELLIRNLPTLESDLEKGCVVVLHEQRLRIRSLPIVSPD